MFRQLLIPYDLSETSRQALFVAERHLKQNPANEVIILHVIPQMPVAHFNTAETMPFYPAELADSLEKHIRSHLHSLSFSSNLLTQVKIVIERGDPVATLLSFESKSDLIAMTTHGHKGIKKFLLGSITEKLVRHARKPVLIVRQASSWPPKKILVPVSFEDKSFDALKQLVDWFPESSTQYHLVHVLSEPDLFGIYEDVLNSPLDVNLDLLMSKAGERIDALKKQVFNGPVQSQILHGSLSDEINKYANSIAADLVAIPTHHNEGLKHFFLGSESEKLVRELEQNVLCLSL